MTETRVKSKKTNPLQFIKRNYIRCHTCIEDSSMFYHRKKIEFIYTTIYRMYIDTGGSVPY